MCHKTAATVVHTIGIDTGKNTLHLIGLDEVVVACGGAAEGGNTDAPSSGSHVKALDESGCALSGASRRGSELGCLAVALLGWLLRRRRAG